MEKNDLHIDLLDRSMRGLTSPEEEQSLLAWLEDPVNREEIYAFYRRKWNEASDKHLPLEVQERMFRAIKERMGESKATPPRRKVSRILWTWLSHAAVGLLCLGLGAALYGYLHQPAILVPRDHVVLADNGQRANVILPDGTEVWLNSHTRLTYNTDYGVKERSVTLEGEAYFEVAKDEDRRFVVKAGGMEVEALGTAFNVDAYTEDEEVAATLFEGSVCASAGNKIVMLSPNQTAVFNKSTYKLSVDNSQDVSYVRLWRSNELAFSGESLEDIAAVLHRMYSIEVRFLSNKVKRYRFSGVIRNNSLDNVFEIISLTAPITYEAVGDTIYINEK